MTVDECAATLPLAAQDSSEEDFEMVGVSELEKSLPTSSLAGPSSSSTLVREENAVQASLASVLVTVQQDLPVTKIMRWCFMDVPHCPPLEILAPVTSCPNFDHLGQLTKSPSLPNLDVESSSTTHSTSMGTELTITTVALRDPLPRISSAELAVTTVAIISNVVVPSRFVIPIVAAQSSEHSLIV
ncbi:hypothetical protein BT96DRAFT_990341 [Gymnopus androsaceus JB14]|uniref:Uncharacterized protein n=1 Tax=Gymnopus androsaceus JB14 TaxID=1447944 RepID=A0A6A4HZ41_9AGAR|nr:hypothetical protein BT96DRAFT_990341 [Gymnopus androsaceus JB14]